MKIWYDDNPKGLSIAIGGDPADLLTLGHALLRVEKVTFLGDKTPSKFYPKVLNTLVFIPLPEKEALLELKVEEQKLFLFAGSDAARKLGQSLENVFGENAWGQHFHLDYFEDNGLLAPTDFHLIFQSDQP